MTQRKLHFVVCIHDEFVKWEDIFMERSCNASLNSYMKKKLFWKILINSVLGVEDN